MSANENYKKQTELLIRVLPLVAEQTVFALKGGTAINFFIRDLPRLSVDIDLTYLPITDRPTALSGIQSALKILTKRIKEVFPKYKVSNKSAGDISTTLFINDGNNQIKIEPNHVIRGTVFAPEKGELCPTARELFQTTLLTNILSLADLYGGKICAALDRQHPRDLFDIKLLLENEGLTEQIRKAFLVYLISHPRPINELLAPNLLDFKKTFENEFEGMPRIPVSYEDLVAARYDLIKLIKSTITTDEKAFLISFKEGNPAWGRLGLQNIETLPAVKWKLTNIARMDKKKHTESLNKLKNIL